MSREASVPAAPRLRFLSLFVPDLATATQAYTSVLGVEPSDAVDLPDPHPYAHSGPVVFDLGEVKLALYQCDLRVTHPGDVGIGITPVGSVAELCERVPAEGGRVFYGPKPLGAARELAIFMLPDRHFFEVVGASDRGP